MIFLEYLNIDIELSSFDIQRCDRRPMSPISYINARGRSARPNASAGQSRRPRSIHFLLPSYGRRTLSEISMYVHPLVPNGHDCGVRDMMPWVMARRPSLRSRMCLSPYNHVDVHFEGIYDHHQQSSEKVHRRVMASMSD